MTAALIARVANMIAYKAPVSEIRRALLAAGCDEGRAYLIYKAGQILFGSAV